MLFPTPKHVKALKANLIPTLITYNNILGLMFSVWWFQWPLTISSYLMLCLFWLILRVFATIEWFYQLQFILCDVWETKFIADWQFSVTLGFHKVCQTQTCETVHIAGDCDYAGLPVSQGEVTAKARVVTSLQAASEIQVLCSVLYLYIVSTETFLFKIISRR